MKKAYSRLRGATEAFCPTAAPAASCRSRRSRWPERNSSPPASACDRDTAAPRCRESGNARRRALGIVNRARRKSVATTRSALAHIPHHQPGLRIAPLLHQPARRLRQPLLRTSQITSEASAGDHHVAPAAQAPNRLRYQPLTSAPPPAPTELHEEREGESPSAQMRGHPPVRWYFDGHQLHAEPRRPPESAERSPTPAVETPAAARRRHTRSGANMKVARRPKRSAHGAQQAGADEQAKKGGGGEGRPGPRRRRRPARRCGKCRRR